MNVNRLVWRDCMPDSNWIDDCRPRWLIVMGKYKLLGRCNSFSRKFPFYRFIGLHRLQIAKKTFIIQVYYHYGRNFQFLFKYHDAPSKTVKIKIKYIELFNTKISVNIYQNYYIWTSTRFRLSNQKLKYWI